MAITQTSDILLLNEYGNTAVTERARTTSTGKTSTRVTVDVKAEAVGVMVDATLLGKGPADAIAKAIADQVRAISEPASEQTQLQRKYAANAAARGAPWARRRYAGGRMGASTPGAASSDRLFNDSGRMANGIVARATRDGTFTINVPSNRLNPSTFTGAAFDAMLRQLVDLVPALRDPSTLGDVPAVRDSIADATIEAIVKSTAAAEERFRQALADAASAAVEVAQSAGEFAEE